MEVWLDPNCVEHDAGMNPGTFAKTHQTPPDQRHEQTFKKETVKTQHLLIIHCVVISLPDTRTCHEVVRVANQGPL